MIRHIDSIKFEEFYHDDEYPENYTLYFECFDLAPFEEYLEGSVEMYDGVTISLQNGIATIAGFIVEDDVQSDYGHTDIELPNEDIEYLYDIAAKAGVNIKEVYA